jgi:hypothetical protein
MSEEGDVDIRLVSLPWGLERKASGSKREAIAKPY